MLRWMRSVCRGGNRLATGGRGGDVISPERGVREDGGEIVDVEAVDTPAM